VNVGAGAGLVVDAGATLAQLVLLKTGADVELRTGAGGTLLVTTTEVHVVLFQ